MALTTLDPNTALIIVDLQKGIVGLPLIHPIDGVLSRNRLLADAFRARALPVVLVNVTGGAPGRTEQPRLNLDALPADFAEIVPELGQQPSDIAVTKRTWGAFASTDLDKQLEALGVTQVVVTGVATGTGVESTARQAYEQGFNVTLAIDAMTDRSQEAHDYSVGKVFPRLGETGSTDDVIALLEGRS
jgi:nicotinamidase-related amidase